LRQVMDDYAVDKPIIHTEGSLICPEYNTTYCNPPGDEFYETQAHYVVWLYIRNWANGIEGTIWYQFEGPGWRYGGLLDENQDPKPAYHALEYLNQELGKATYIGRVEIDPNIAGYEFTTNQKKIWVLWSPDEDPHSITLPNTALMVLDKYGYEIVLSSNQIEVNKPIYVEFNK
ncbi:hypothetical protein KA005_69645, partial [bacterium]|nr:hypothetical protein [bacterium]